MPVKQFKCHNLALCSSCIMLQIKSLNCTKESFEIEELSVQHPLQYYSLANCRFHMYYRFANFRFRMYYSRANCRFHMYYSFGNCRFYMYYSFANCRFYMSSTLDFICLYHGSLTCGPPCITQPAVHVFETHGLQACFDRKVDFDSLNIHCF